MNELKVFIASPISGFQDEKQYNNYRKSVILLIRALSNRYEVYSELQNISGINSYDTPEESLKNDFSEIDKSDIFVLLHPMRMQTSTLIELGYAYAQKKPLLIVGEAQNMPYMILGLKKPFYNALWVDAPEINDKTITLILNSLDKLKKDIL